MAKNKKEKKRNKVELENKSPDKPNEKTLRKLFRELFAESLSFRYSGKLYFYFFSSFPVIFSTALSNARSLSIFFCSQYQS